MRGWILLHSLPWVLVFLAGCGGSSAPAPTAPSDGGLPDTGDATAPSPSDAGADASRDVPPAFLTLMRTGNDLCLPQTFVADPVTGAIPCRIFDFLPAGDPSCANAGPGLSYPGPKTVGAVDAKEMWDAGQPLCELAQLPASAWGGPSCVSSAQPGFCYVSGAAAGNNCAQAIRFSSSGAPPAGAAVVFGCN
jgi:hypothetical protein